MKRLRLALAALLIMSLVFPLFARSSADSSFMFTAFDASVARNTSTETVPEDTMSYISDGRLYVYYEHFAKLTTISRVYYNTRTHEIVVYNMNKSLIFDLANDQAYERPSGKFYTDIAKWKNGNIFLPLTVVAEAFNLSASYIESSYSPAPLLRIDSQAPSISDTYYVQQLSSFLHNLYTNSVAPPASTVSGVTPPEATAPSVVTPEPDPAKIVYLSFEGALTEYTADILDALAAANRPVTATFFVPPDAIMQDAALIRRAYSEGHTIGLLLPGGWESAERAVRELQSANELLKSVILTKTRLVNIDAGAENTDADVLDAFILNGCRLWNSNIAPELSGDAQPGQVLSGLRSSLSRTAGTLVVRLDSSETAAAILPQLLSYIEGGNYSLLGITDWDRPINGVDEIR